MDLTGKRIEATTTQLYTGFSESDDAATTRIEQAFQRIADQGGSIIVSGMVEIISGGKPGTQGSSDRSKNMLLIVAAFDQTDGDISR